jgi:hypothetical protein
MLNRHAVFGEIGTIQAPAGEFFIRPDADSKAFAGTTMTGEKFDSWRKDLLAIESWTTIPVTTEVMIAPLQTIYAEYRCYVIDGKVRTASRYKTGHTVAYSSEVGQMFIDYANERIREWNPRIAVVLDLAHTPDGIKIIETNAISSSGFYAIDMNLFVNHINMLEEIL